MSRSYVKRNSLITRINNWIYRYNRAWSHVWSSPSWPVEWVSHWEVHLAYSCPAYVLNANHFPCTNGSTYHDSPHHHYLSPPLTNLCPDNPPRCPTTRRSRLKAKRSPICLSESRFDAASKTWARGPTPPPKISRLLALSILAPNAALKGYERSQT